MSLAVVSSTTDSLADTTLLNVPTIVLFTVVLTNKLIDVVLPDTLLVEPFDALVVGPTNKLVVGPAGRLDVDPTGVVVVAAVDIVVAGPPDVEPTGVPVVVVIGGCLVVVRVVVVLADVGGGESQVLLNAGALASGSAVMTRLSTSKSVRVLNNDMRGGLSTSRSNQRDALALYH